MRVDCKYKNMCGGCNLEQDYTTTLSSKRDYVQKLFNDNNIKYTISNTVGMYYPSIEIKYTYLSLK